MNNFIVLHGRTTKDVEVETLPNSNTQVAEFSIAVQRTFKQDGEYKADFINCSAFGEGLIGVLTKYVQKGDRINLGGRLQIDRWKDNNGNWQNMTKVIVSDVTLVETRRDRQEQQGQGNNNYQSQNTPRNNEPTPPPIESDLPF